MALLTPVEQSVLVEMLNEQFDADVTKTTDENTIFIRWSFLPDQVTLQQEQVLREKLTEFVWERTQYWTISDSSRNVSERYIQFTIEYQEDPEERENS